MEAREIEKLIEFIARSGLEEVRLETDQIKLHVKRGVTVTQPTVSVPDVFSVSSHPSASVASANTHGGMGADDRCIEFKAPLVGTFYQSPNPGAPPFVQVGDPISRGQKLCVIEAMKLFNEIESDVEGTVVKVLVEDASPVAYDQPLFLIDTQSVTPSHAESEKD